MVHRPLQKFGRFVLAACAVSLGAVSLGAQTTPSTTAPTGPNLSRFDLFLGYSYYGAHGMLKPQGIAYSSIDEGAIASGAYFFNKYVGMELSVVAHPSGNNDSIYTYSAGPIFRKHMDNYSLFAHANAGGVYIGGPNRNDETHGPPPVYYNPNRWGPTLAVGGGMDYDLPFWNNRFSIRLFQADYRYIHANFGPVRADGNPLGGRANIGAAELSAGLVTHFGSIVPPPPVTYSCSVSPSTVYPGDPLTVTGTAMNLNPKKTATYTWSGDGFAVAGSSSTGNIDTKNLAAGTYTVKGHVSEGSKPGEMADCSSQFTVKAFEPPTISCSASPSTVNSGDSSTITASATSPQNRPLTYSYSSTAGSISGTTSTATLSTAGAAPGSTITVTCNVVDDKGQTASSTTTVSLSAPPPAPAPTTSNLCSLDFGRDRRRPARVNNEAKACLDDVALNLQRSSDARLALVGNKEGREPERLAAERAANARDYLTKEKGIDASRISIYTGTTDGKTVTTTLIPSGANFDSTGDTPVDESMLHPVRHHRRHHHR